MIVHRLIVPFAVAVLLGHVGEAFAQGAFPAPLPGQSAPANSSAFPPANSSPFPPVNGGAPAASVGGASPFPSAGAPPFGGGPPQAAAGQDCMKEFTPLREETEKRGKLLTAVGQRHGSAEEACKAIGNFVQAEVKMMRYVEANSARCGIPGQVADQLKKGHKNYEAMQKKVCAVAQQQEQRGPAAPSLSEALGTSAASPEATSKKGGSTFDTLSGNVLTR